MGHWETTGASDEWYTPKFVFDALGNPSFDLDVAAPMLIPAYIGARRWLWKDSLESDWQGFVWMNAPYGGRNSLIPWLAKFFDHGNGIALVPDRTSAPWFQDAWVRASLALFTRKIRFLRPDGSEGKSPSNGTALLSAGERGHAALIQVARNGLGILANPIAQKVECDRHGGAK